MASSLSGLFRMLAQSWPAAVPLPVLVGEVGPEAVNAAQRLGMVRRVALAAGMAYPCASFCTMRLVLEDGGLVAVCEHLPPKCADVRLDEEEALLLELDTDTVAPALQRMLRLDQTPYGGDHAKVVLGARRVGAQWVRFVLAPRPTRLLASGWVSRAVQDDPDRVLVVLTFTASQIPADAPRRIDGTRVEWVGLDEVLTEGGVDLVDLWRTLGPVSGVAAELWPRYTFVVDDGRDIVYYAGVRLPLDRYPLEAKLLRALLEHPGAFVDRNELLVILWPDEFDKPKATDFVALDRCLRQAKSVLTGVFRKIRVPEGGAGGADREPADPRRREWWLPGGRGPRPGVDHPLIAWFPRLAPSRSRVICGGGRPNSES